MLNESFIGGAQMTEKTFNFLRFENVGIRVGDYIISINKNGVFGINSGFYRTEGIKDYSYIVLFYAEAEKTIGIAFTKSSDEKGTFKITHGKSSAYIVARSFFHSLTEGKSDNLSKYVGRYTPNTYSDPNIGKMFYIDLKEKQGSDKEDR